MITPTQLEACLRVLRATETPMCTSVLLTWGQADLDAYVALSRAGYVRLLEDTRRAGPYRWDRISATDAGLDYLRQIDAARAERAA